jgi:hypothetical protein
MSRLVLTHGFASRSRGFGRHKNANRDEDPSKSEFLCSFIAVCRRPTVIIGRRLAEETGRIIKDSASMGSFLMRLTSIMHQPGKGQVMSIFEALLPLLWLPAV